MAFVGAKIVENDDVAGFERWQQDLFDIGAETLAIDWSIKDTWGGNPVMPECCEKCECVPMAMRNLGNEPLAPGTSPMLSGHVCLGPSLVNEHEARDIEPALVLLPLFTPPGDVGPVPFAGVKSFF